MSESGKRERRVKVLRVNPDYIIQMLNGQNVQYTMFPENDHTPPGTKVLSVNANWERHTIDFLIYHESFPVVPEGQIAPDAMDGTVYELFRKVPSPFIKDSEMKRIEREVGEHVERGVKIEDLRVGVIGSFRMVSNPRQIVSMQNP